MRKIYKGIVLIISLVLIVISFCSCGKCKNDEHKFERKTVKESTCTSDGLVHNTCNKCGYAEENTIPALGHDYKQVSSTATCTAAGKTTYKCSRCGDIKEEETEALGHKWYEATCKEPKHCIWCDTTIGDKKSHNFANGKTCSYCGQEIIISMPSFPKKVSQIRYDGEIEATVEITDISYKVTNYDDGQNYVEFTISGKKTYDIEGASFSRETTFGYKVYDQNGVVKYSGVFR